MQAAPAPPTNLPRKRLMIAIASLLAILALAAWLRFSLIGYGLPLLLWEDEPIYLRRALNLGFGDWNPHYFKKPGFFLYFYYGWYWLAYQAGDWANWQAYVDAFRADPGAVTLLGRAVTATMGVATVAMTFALARRIGASLWASLAAAALMAIYSPHVKYSAIVASDAPALLCLMACACSAVGYYQTGRWRDVLLCGAMAGLAVAFKYNFFTLALPLSAHGLRWLAPPAASGLQAQADKIASPRRFARLFDARILACLAAAVVTFLALCPYTVLDFGAFWRDFDLERRHVLLRQAHDATRRFLPMAGFGKTFFHILPKALGWPLWAAGLLSLGLAGVRLWRERLASPSWLIPLAFMAIFLLAASQFRLVNAKYLLPAAPFWMLLIALGLDSLRVATITRGRWPASLASLAMSLMLALLAWPMAADAAYFARVHAKPDTRTLMNARLLARVAPRETVMVEPEALPLGAPAFLRTPFLPAMRGKASFLPAPDAYTVRIHALARSSWLVMRLKPRKTPDKRLTLPWSPAYYAQIAREFELVDALTPFVSTRADRRALRQAATSNQALDQALLGQYQTWERRKTPDERSGPILLLWRRR
ncbi:MAG: glycosyltransferase family 39 protein [Vampirovibrionales bacterium]|nr:glycosyltransferase family 39 protein [Vampirovibrionales bacterium]